MRKYPEDRVFARFSVYACLPASFGTVPSHVIHCSYLGRRQTGGLKPLKTLQTPVPGWIHENQLCLFQLLQSPIMTKWKKWDNGSGVKLYWVNSRVFVNSSQVFEGCSAPESRRQDLCNWHKGKYCSLTPGCYSVTLRLQMQSWVIGGSDWAD